MIGYEADSTAPRSPEWVGNAVADVLHLDIESDCDRKHIKTILNSWYETGVLKRVEKLGPIRHLFMYVDAGEWTEG